MDWRWMASVSFAGASVGVIAWSACAVVAANAFDGQKFDAQKYDAAPSPIVALDVKGGGANGDSGPSWAGLQPGSVAALSDFRWSVVRTSSVFAASDDVRLAEREGFDPPRVVSELVYEANALRYGTGSSEADDEMVQLAEALESHVRHHRKILAVPGDHLGLSMVRYDCSRPSWDISRSKSHRRSNLNRARYCVAFRPASPEKGIQQAETRRGPGEQRAPAKFALIIGVAF